MPDKALPPNIRERIYGSGPEVTWHVPGTDDVACEGATFHSPRPLFVQNTSLVRREWWPESAIHATWAQGPDAHLCGTCRDNLSVLLQLLHHADGDLDWEIRREFGNKIRALAATGWEWFANHRPTT